MEGTVVVFTTATTCAWLEFLPRFAFAAAIWLLPVVQMALAFARNSVLVSAVVAVLLMLLPLLLLLPHPAAANPTISAAMIATTVTRLGSDTFWFTAARSGREWLGHRAPLVSCRGRVADPMPYGARRLVVGRSFALPRVAVKHTRLACVVRKRFCVKARCTPSRFELNGETRTRTGDTTIFRRSLETL